MVMVTYCRSVSSAQELLNELDLEEIIATISMSIRDRVRGKRRRTQPNQVTNPSNYGQTQDPTLLALVICLRAPIKIQLMVKKYWFLQNKMQKRHFNLARKNRADGQRLVTWKRVLMSSTHYKLVQFLKFLVKFSILEKPVRRNHGIFMIRHQPQPHHHIDCISKIWAAGLRKLVPQVFDKSNQGTLEGR